jgi:manganese/zinc/iron transport system permease protein
VGAFDAVGSILVVALMIGPPATAFLLTDRLPRMILLSAAIGALSAISGYWASYALDVSIAGSMATMTGVWFGLAFLLAPERGMIALQRRRIRQRWEFAQTMLTMHLRNHEGSDCAVEESRIAHLHEHLRWDPRFASRVVERAMRSGLVRRETTERLALTDEGRRRASSAAAA